MKRLSDLIGLKVRTESGHSLGRVYDVRAEVRPRSLVATGLVVGGTGLLERLGIGAPGTKGRTRRRDVVSWGLVVRADRRGVVVRDAARASS